MLLQDRNEDALLKFREALKMQIYLLGPSHPDVATTYSNLGVVSRACGHHAESVAFFRKAFELCNEVCDLSFSKLWLLRKLDDIILSYLQIDFGKHKQ